MADAFHSANVSRGRMTVKTTSRETGADRAGLLTYRYVFVSLDIGFDLVRHLVGSGAG